MRVTFWGVRGSLPSPLTAVQMRRMQRKLLQEIRLRGLPGPEEEERFLDGLPAPLRGPVGGNTSCVQVDLDGQTFIFDAGSGLHPLGQALMDGPCGRGQGRLKLFLSHTHWDHVQGLPYFAPIYVPGNRVEVYSGFTDIAGRLALQQRPEYFPVPLEAVGADLTFHQLPAGPALELEGGGAAVRVRAQELHHPGGAYGYRLEADGAVLIYAADSDYCEMNRADLDLYCEFFQGADLLIFDSQFSFNEARARADWGHASAVLGVNIARQAGVRRLALFHHSTDYSDATLHDLCAEAAAYRNLYFPDCELEIFLATEGLFLELGANTL
ncbi:MAG: MBL fold metallo-hydrolase [Candidatus Zixiibacteriota bacterium]|nr:MAG: MBL fold metallo-hydrolase [candidate division Zixibacteria bacterium]